MSHIYVYYTIIPFVIKMIHFRNVFISQKLYEREFHHQNHFVFIAVCLQIISKCV